MTPIAAIRCACLATALLIGVATPALAQEQPAAWPSRPVKIVTPLAAGGAADILARAVGDELFSSLKQAVVIENRPGGGGILAAGAVARAQPDGYTLIPWHRRHAHHHAGAHQKRAVRPGQRFHAADHRLETPICLLVHKDLPVNSVPELVAYAKANPGKLSFGSSGPNTTHHLAGEFLKNATGIDMVHVPYRGGNPAMTDFLAGQIPVLFATLSTALPHLSGGGFKVLGTVEASRSRARPEIPTIGESIPGYGVPSSFLGFLAPAGLSAPMTERLNAALVKTIETPSVRKTLEGSGFEVTTGTSAQFGTIIKAALERYRKIAADARIEPQ